MRVLLDTNILTRCFHHGHAHHDVAVRAVAAVRAGHEELCIVPQNLYEFWVVATRPLAENGFGLKPYEAVTRLAELKEAFKLKHDSPSLIATWERLVEDYKVCGKAGHDARLVAAMEESGIEAILTFNVRDFSRFRNVTVLSATEIGTR